MSFEEEFDRKIRLKTEEAEYAFDPGNWEKASAMIDADRKTGGLTRVRRLIIPAAVVVTAIVGVIAYNNNSDAGAKAPSASALADNTGAGQDYSPVQAHEAEQAMLSQNPEAPAQEAGGSANPGARTNPVTNPNSSVNETNTTYYYKTNSSPAVATAKAGTGEQRTNATTEAVAPADAVSAVSQGNNETTAVVSTPPSAVNAAVVVPFATVPADNAGVNGLIRAEENLPEPFARLKARMDARRAGEQQEAAGAIAQNPDAVAQYENVQQLDLVGFNQADEQELRAMPFVLLPRYDDYYKSRRNTHFLNIELGADYGLGWHTAKGTDGRGFNWFGGANYGYNICDRFALGIGLQAYNIQNTREAFFTGTTTEYSFGSAMSGTVISSHNLVYAAIPLKIYYSLNAFNRLGLGFNAAWLVSAQSDVQTFGIQDNAKINMVSTRTSGIYSGTRSTNLQLSAFYKLQLGTRIAANAEFMYGLNDIFKNTATVKNAEKPVSVRLSLQYTLFTR